MINFYDYYNGELDKQHYASLIYKLKLGFYSSELVRIQHIIKKAPYHSYHYALHVIKGRWVEVEPTIMKDPFSAYRYAYLIIKGRWLEAEPYIKSDRHWWKLYRRDFDI